MLRKLSQIQSTLCSPAFLNLSIVYETFAARHSSSGHPVNVRRERTWDLHFIPRDRTAGGLTRCLHAICTECPRIILSFSDSWFHPAPIIAGVDILLVVFSRIYILRSLRTTGGLRYTTLENYFHARVINWHPVIHENIWPNFYFFLYFANVLIN